MPEDRLDDMKRIAGSAKSECRPEVSEGRLTPEQACAFAARYVETRHPDATCAFIFGSSIKGSYQPYSDIDLIVVEPAVALAETKRLMFDGIPIEAHVLDRVSFINGLQAAARTGVSSLVFETVDAPLVGGNEENARWFRESASAILERGPPPASELLRDTARRNITTRIADLLKCESFAERSGVADALTAFLYIAHFARRGLWQNRGKWMARMSPEFARELSECLDNARHGRDFAGLIQLAERELEEWGGFLWSDTASPLWPGKLRPQGAQANGWSGTAGMEAGSFD